MFTAVDMRTEFNALLTYLAQTGKTEDLVASAISQDGAFPVHKAVQSAQLADDLHSRPQIEVIIVGKDHLDAYVPQMLGCHSLDRGLTAHGHKDRGGYCAVGSDQLTQPRPGIGIGF